MGIEQDKTAQDKTAQDQRIQELKEYYNLEEHPEGGWFAECYTSEAAAHEDADNDKTTGSQNPAHSRPYAGSIYFLLDKADISHFHRIDCEEVWYFHEGCGLKITTIDSEGRVDRILLGSNMTEGERVLAVIPRGVIFASQTLSPDGYCFVSCMTAPKFSYDGFELISRDELKRLFPNITEDVLALAFEDREITKE